MGQRLSNMVGGAYPFKILPPSEHYPHCMWLSVTLMEEHLLSLNQRWFFFQHWFEWKAEWKIPKFYASSSAVTMCFNSTNVHNISMLSSTDPQGWGLNSRL